MKVLTTLAVAMALVAVPASVSAQDAAASTSATSSTEAAASSTAGNYGTLISSLNANKMADLSTFTTTSTVNCVKVSTLKGDASGDAKALDNALSKNSAGVTSLKTTINANAALKAKLDPTTCPVDDVVAVTAEADGSFTVYVDDRS